jgi:MATE family multidrug resistance protein
MTERRSGHHTARIAALAWPILIGQLAVVANGVIDTAMTSRFSTTDLAALALGISIYVSVFVGLNGIMQALMPVIGQLFGAKRFHAIGFEVKQAIWLALFLSAIGCLALLPIRRRSTFASSRSHYRPQWVSASMPRSIRHWRGPRW